MIVKASERRLAIAVGTRVRERREALGLTMRNIRGISPGFLCHVEAGKTLPGAARLLALSRALLVSIDWIVTGREHSRARR